MRRVLAVLVLVAGCGAPARIETTNAPRPERRTVEARAGEVKAAPAAPPTISLRGSRLALSAFEDEPLETTLLVEGDRRVALDLTLLCPEGVSVSPSSVTIPAGRSVALQLRVATGTSIEGELVFETRTRERGAAVALRPLPITVARMRRAPTPAPPPAVSAPAVAPVVAPEPAPEPRVEPSTEVVHQAVPEVAATVVEAVSPPAPASIAPVESAIPVIENTGAAVAPRSVEQPAPATAAPNRDSRRALGVALIGLALLGAVALLLFRSRVLARRFGRKQIRAIGSNRRLSYERYLLRERRTGPRTAVAPDGPLALALEVTDDSVLVSPLEGCEAFAPDGRPLEPGSRLEHGDLLRVVRGAFERRFIYLARDPSADELVKTWGPRALPSDEGALEDEDVFVILEDRHELVAPSARHAPVELVEPLGLDSDETVILTDSQEDRLLDD